MSRETEEQQASQHGASADGTHHVDHREIVDDLTDMRNQLGLQGAPARPRPVDARPEGALWEAALGSNLTALHEAIGAVRAGMTSGDEQILQGDVRKVVRHANAISALLQQIADPRLLKSHREPVGRAIQEVLHLDKEAEARPELASFMRSSRLGGDLSEIQAKIGHR
jgi:hypothetical protein